MTQLEIYKKALDGLAEDIDHLKHLCAKRYDLPGYAATVKKLADKQKDYKWLEDEIKAMEGM